MKQHASVRSALTRRTQEALTRICKSWGIHDSEFFASMQLLKPYNPDKGGVHLNTTTKMDVLKLQVCA